MCSWAACPPTALNFLRPHLTSKARVDSVCHYNFSDSEQTSFESRGHLIREPLNALITRPVTMEPFQQRRDGGPVLPKECAADRAAPLRSPACLLWDGFLRPHGTLRPSGRMNMYVPTAPLDAAAAQWPDYHAESTDVL